MPENTETPISAKQTEEASELADDLLELLEAIDSVSPTDLFDNSGHVVPATDGASIENPRLSHELYHGVIQALLRKHLPKTTSEIEAERKIAKAIRRPVNLYLNEGKGGVDGKMNYNHRKRAVADVIVGWVNEYGGSNYSALHGRLVRLCTDAGLKV